MHKSAIILVSMLFSIAVPTLAESAAGYARQDAQVVAHVSHTNDSSVSRHYSGLRDNHAIGALDGTKSEDFHTMPSDHGNGKGADNQILTANEEE